MPGLVRLRVMTLGPLDLVLTKLCRADDAEIEDIRYLLARERLSRTLVLAALDRVVVPPCFAEAWPENRARVVRLLNPE